MTVKKKCPDGLPFKFKDRNHPYTLWRGPKTEKQARGLLARLRGHHRDRLQRHETFRNGVDRAEENLLLAFLEANRMTIRQSYPERNNRKKLRYLGSELQIGAVERERIRDTIAFIRYKEAELGQLYLNRLEERQKWNNPAEKSRNSASL